MLSLACTDISLFSRYYSKFQTWRKQGIPGPNPWFFYMDLMHLLTPNFMTLDLRRVKQYGKIFGVHDGEVASLIVADPEVLKEMLVRNFASFADRRQQPSSHKIFKKFLTQLNGDDWRQTRSIISPTFTSGKMKAMYPLISDAVDLMMDKIKEGSGKEFDLKDLYGCLSMDIIARCAFAVDTNANDGNPFVYHAKAFFTFSVWKIALFVFLPKFIMKRFTITFSPRKHTNFLEALALQMISERRKQMKQGVRANKYNDFLQLMMEAGTHDDEEVDEDNPHEVPATKGKTLTDEEIVSNVILILVAGYETTASLLSFVTYNLACNPDVQERLRQEVEDAGDLNYDSLTKLHYLDAVINETLRVFPPVMRVDRRVSDKDGFTFDSHLGKIHMPYGSDVLVPIYTIHHMEEYHPDPEKFDPDRFMPENRDKMVPYSFLPFVLGPRNCVGMRFALLEAKKTLVTIIKKYRFVKTSNTDVPLDFSGSIVLMAPKRVVVKIEERN